MAESLWGKTNKKGWPDMRSLRWPPETAENTGATAAGPVAPFELVADPAGSGGLVVAPVRGTSPGDSPGETEEAARPVGDQSEMESEGVAEGEHGQLIREMRALRRSIEALTAALSRADTPGLHSGALPTGGPSPERGSPGMAKGGTPAVIRSAMIPVRDIPDTQAMEEIQNYFLHHQGETIFPAAIADTLGLPVLKVAKLCEILATTGRLARTK